MTQDFGMKSGPQTASPLIGAAILPRAAITIGALLAYHFAGFIPLPGVDPDAAVAFFRDYGTNVPFQNVSGFMLGTVPLFAALIFAEVLMLVFPSLRQRQADPASRDGFWRGVVAAALAIAAIQSWGIASGLEAVTGLVPEPGLGFRISTLVSMVAATLLIAWLAKIISKYGLGHGFWLLFLAPVCISAASTAAALVSGATSGDISAAALLLPLTYIAAAAFALTRLERANPGIAASESLIWPVAVASAAALWLLTPILPFLSVDQMNSVVAMTLPGQPMRLAALVVLIPAITLLRLHSLSEAGLLSATTRSALTVALVLAAIVIAGDLLIGWSGLSGIPDALALVILVSVALSMLPSVRTSKTGLAPV